MAARREGLRHRREQLGFTQEALAQALGVATSTVRGWERGVNLPLLAVRPRLARELDVSLVEVSHWFNDEERDRAPTGLTVPAWLGHLAALEQGAARIWSYEPVVVPGLLQTADYAAALERAEPGPPSEADVDRWVGARLARQAVLDRHPDPLELSVLIDESVLWRVAGGGAVMAAQLDHLATAAARPTVEVRVLPLDAGVFSASWGSFSVVTSPGSSQPYMAWVEDRVGAHYLDRPGEVEAHVKLFEHLHHAALPPDETVGLIHAVAKERYR